MFRSQRTRQSAILTRDIVAGKQMSQGRELAVPSEVLQEAAQADDDNDEFDSIRRRRRREMRARGRHDLRSGQGLPGGFRFCTILPRGTGGVRPAGVETASRNEGARNEAARPSPAPSAGGILRQWLKYDSPELDLAHDYIWLENKEMKILRKDGSAFDTTTETREVMNLYDAKYERLIRKNGKDLSPDKARKEQARFDKAVEKRAHETPQAKAKREEAERKDAAESLVCEEEFLKAFDYRLAGSAAVNGRPAWIVDADPAPHSFPPLPFAEEPGEIPTQDMD